MDLWNFKYDFKDFLLTQQPDKMGFGTDFKLALQGAFESHISYNKKVAPLDDAPQDLDWQVGLKVGIIFCQFWRGGL